MPKRIGIRFGTQIKKEIEKVEHTEPIIFLSCERINSTSICKGKTSAPSAFSA